MIIDSSKPIRRHSYVNNNENATGRIVEQGIMIPRFDGNPERPKSIIGKQKCNLP